MSNKQELIDWTSNLVKSLVEKPEDIVTKATTDEKGLLIEFYVPKYAIGQLIGKGGKNADALRTIISLYGMRHDARVSIKINEA